jgi:hypothetical protein
MGDDVRYDSLAELLIYIATESEQVGVWALKHLEKGVRHRKIPKLGARRKSKGPFFSKPPSPDDRRRLISAGACLSLLGHAGDLLKEEGRRGLKCEGTDPYTGERREIKIAEWPLLIVPPEAAFDDEGKVITEVRGISVVAYKEVTGDGLDLERRLPRARTPVPVPTVPVSPTALPEANRGDRPSANAQSQPSAPTTDVPVAQNAPGPNDSAPANPRTATEEEERTKQRGGRKPAVDWSMVDNKIFNLMDENGEFMVGTDWNAQARLEESIEDFCETKFSVRPGEITIRNHVRIALKRWRQQ